MRRFRSWSLGGLEGAVACAAAVFVCVWLGEQVLPARVRAGGGLGAGAINKTYFYLCKNKLDKNK